MDVFKGVFREEGWAMPLLGKSINFVPKMFIVFERD